MASSSNKLSMTEAISRFAADWRRYRSYVFQATRAELLSESSNTMLDWLWWVLEPLCLMLVYAFMFGIVFNASEPYFPIFIFSGITMWRFFNNSVRTAAGLVKSRKALVTRIYIPKHILLIINLLKNGFKMLMSTAVMLLMVMLYRVPLSPTMLLIIPGYALVFLISYAMGCFVMHVGVFVEDMSYVLNIGLTLLMYFTGTFWSIETRLPAPYGPFLCQANPIALSISIARNGLLYGTNVIRWTYFAWFAVFLLLAVLGTRLVYMNENTYVKVI